MQPVKLMNTGVTLNRTSLQDWLRKGPPPSPGVVAALAAVQAHIMCLPAWCWKEAAQRPGVLCCKADGPVVLEQDTWCAR